MFPNQTPGRKRPSCPVLSENPHFLEIIETPEAEVKTLVGHSWKLNFSFHSCDNICSFRKWVRELAPRLHSNDSRQEEGGDGWELPAAEDGDHEDADHEADIVGGEGEEDVGRPYCQECNSG